MKYLLSLLCVGVLTFGACKSGNPSNNDVPEREVMTASGPWEARINELRSKVRSTENDHLSYRKYHLDSLELNSFSSEFPYWDEVIVYLGKSGIRKVRLQTSRVKKPRIEEFYFHKGDLIYAQIDDATEVLENKVFHGDQYYFMQQKLIFALDKNKDTLDIGNGTVAIVGIDLWNEAEQIKKIISRKDLEY